MNFTSIEKTFYGRVLYLIIAFLLINSTLLAQSERKAIRQGKKLIEYGFYLKALNKFNSIIKPDSSFSEVNLLASICYLELHEPTNALRLINRISYDDDCINFYKAVCYYYLEKFDDARKLLRSVNEISCYHRYTKDELDSLIKNAALSYGASKGFLVRNFGNNINSKYREYCAVMLNKFDSVLFTSRRTESHNKIAEDGMGYESIYITSVNKDQSWISASKFNLDIQSNRNHNATSQVVNEGKEVIIFRNGDLYLAKKVKDRWIEQRKLSAINTGYNETHCFVTPDQNTIYFSSDYLSDDNNLDLFETTKNSDGLWSEPEAIEELNTPYDEDAPFISEDGIFYFSSRGHNSIGGFDVFATRFDKKTGSWDPFNCAYAFEPGKNNDGLTVNIPATIASSVPSEAVDWLVPGLYPEKIEVLIKGLPKTYRKKLVPVKDTVEIICREMPKTEGSLISALGRFIYRRFAVDIPATVWSDETLPDHLKMRISITAPDGKELRAGRDPSLLHREAAGSPVFDEFEALRGKWERNALTAWDFGDLPEHISETGKVKTKWLAYPALEKDSKMDKRVNLRLFLQRDQARAAHPAGVLALYSIHFAKELKFLKRQLVIPPGQTSLADYFGGARQFEKRLYQQFVQSLFSKDIRSQIEFYTYAEKTGPQILTRGRELLQNMLPVLTAYHETRSQISRLQAGNRVNTKIQALFKELLEGLAHLVPENFVELYNKERFIHLERYIKALLIRAQRAPVDFEKDQAKATEVRKFADGLNRLLKALSPSVTEEKRQAIEDYFWMLEEYKVSVFAQELKTAIPISAKRLQDKLRQIERMV